ncbi:MAG: hypothetical protein RLZZ597_597 [Cyanobacteriota bacterium]|jgi:hypothetical protein
MHHPAPQHRTLKPNQSPMLTLTATCRNGTIIPDEPLPAHLEGKTLQIIIQELPSVKKRRQLGSAKGQVWMAPDFNDPLDDFQE